MSPTLELVLRIGFRASFHAQTLWHDELRESNKAVLLFRKLIFVAGNAETLEQELGRMSLRSTCFRRTGIFGDLAASESDSR